MPQRIAFGQHLRQPALSIGICGVQIKDEGLVSVRHFDFDGIGPIGLRKAGLERLVLPKLAGHVAGLHDDGVRARLVVEEPHFLVVDRRIEAEFIG